MGTFNNVGRVGDVNMANAPSMVMELMEEHNLDVLVGTEMNLKRDSSKGVRLKNELRRLGLNSEIWGTTTRALSSSPEAVYQ